MNSLFHYNECPLLVMGFIDAFVYAHRQHRRSIEKPGNFGERENPLHDCHHFCLRMSGNMSN